MVEKEKQKHKEDKNIQRAVIEIIDTLRDLSDPARVEYLKTMVPTSQKVLGLTNPQLKRVILELKQVHDTWMSQQWIELSKALVNEGILECQFLAFELIGRNRKLLDSLSFGDLKELGKNLDNWASVDHFSVAIFGVLWGKGVVEDKHIRELLKSENFWERRVAVVSTVALNLKSRGGKGDTRRTLAICELVVDDHHDMIQKALSWALRELSKHDRNAVIDFMKLHENRLAKRVIREVSHKLDFGTKN